MRPVLTTIAVFVVAFMLGAHAPMFVPQQYQRFLFLPDNKNQSPVVIDSVQSVEPLFPTAIVAQQQRLKEVFVDAPIQRQISTELAQECEEQLDYFQGEQRRGDDDPFIDYRVKQLQERCQ